MSAICLCGVCIPYSAILPLLLVLFQYLCRPLYRMGLLPDILAKKLGITDNANSSTHNKSSKCCDNSTCRTESSVSTDTPMRPQQEEDDNSNRSAIVQVTCQKQLTDLMQTKNPKIIILKFTADWCKPCKMIHPFYEKLATAHSNSNIIFGTVDVDEADDVASEFKVSMMPTFVAIRDGSVVKSVSGANEGKLEDLVRNVMGL